MEQLVYRPGDRYFPIPPAEQALQTVVAEPFFKITDEKPKHMEGICFDRNGDMWFVSMYDSCVCKLDMQKKEIVQKVYVDKDYLPTTVKIHKNGRLYICCIDKIKKGCVYSCEPDGSDIQILLKGFPVDDMVFDSKGGFYITHFTGTPGEPDGGVYYVPPDLSEVRPVIKNVASANGVALSTDETVLWTSEWQGQRIMRHVLSGFRAGTCTVTYQYACGTAGPDSICIDEDDNLYVAMSDQGRVLVFNRFGVPIGQILMPGRDEGKHLFTTCPGVRPGVKEVYIVAADDITDSGAWIFKAGSFAPGHSGAYQFQ